MKRSIQQYQDCKPHVMIDECSDASIMFFMKDAKADILELHKLNERYRDLLMQIAYPRRGTVEEQRDIYEAAKLIQSNFSLQDLRGDL